MRTILTKIRKKYKLLSFLLVGGLSLTIGSSLVYFHSVSTQQEIAQSSAQVQQLKDQLAATQLTLETLKKQDQIQINLRNSEEIENIQETYKQTVRAYEALLEINPPSKEYSQLSKLIAVSLGQLSERNYSSAQATLVLLTKEIERQKQVQVAELKIPDNVEEKTTPPSNGYARQQVTTPVGTYMVDIISADLNNTRVIVDTASSADCANDCPVLPLEEYVTRNGAFAGINGSYFCPATYPTCAGKTNSFDTLLMNKDKKYFNSENNIYSTIPAVIFSNGKIRFVSKSLEWGRDTNVDSVIANQPLLVFGGNNIFAGDSEVKRAGKGSRSFVGNKGNTVYIGVVHNVSAAEMAHVLHSLGLDNALNLDSGGSTALWSGEYKVGPGRNIPNAILFVRK